MDETLILSAMVNKTLNKAFWDHRISEVWDMRDLEAISGPAGRVDSRVNSGQFWTLFRTLSRPSLRNLMKYLKIAFIWP